MDATILTILNDTVSVQTRTVNQNLKALTAAARKIAACLESGQKLLLFGNGGSAADAQHIAAEFVNRFRMERPPLAALALTTDTSILTSIGNDYSFDDIFVKQVKALGRKGDTALGISTSGNSTNVVAGIQAAKNAGLHTIALTGRGGRLADTADQVLTVESEVTARIQESHILMSHILCELVDIILFDSPR